MKAVKNIVIKSKEQYQENLETLQKLENVLREKKYDQIKRANALATTYIDNLINFDIDGMNITVRPDLGFNKRNKDGFIPFEIQLDNETWSSIKFTQYPSDVVVEFSMHNKYSSYHDDMNTYSGKDTLKRLSAIGRLAALIDERKDDIIRDMNLMMAPYEKQVQKYLDDVYQTQHERGLAQLCIQRLEKQERFEMAFKGVDIPKGHDHPSLKTFEYGYNKTVYNVTKFQVVGKSQSGKSCDVKVTLKNYYAGVGEPNEVDQLLKNVRIDKVQDYLDMIIEN